MKAIASYLRHSLRDLDIRGCWRIGKDFYIILNLIFPSYVIHSLAECLQFIQILPEVQLDLVEFVQKLAPLFAGDSGMGCVAEYCSKLKKLRIADCRDITEKSLRRARARGVKATRFSDFVTKSGRI